MIRKETVDKPEQRETPEEPVAGAERVEPTEEPIKEEPEPIKDPDEPVKEGKEEIPVEPKPVEMEHEPEPEPLKPKPTICPECGDELTLSGICMWCGYQRKDEKGRPY